MGAWTWPDSLDALTAAPESTPAALRGDGRGAGARRAAEHRSSARPTGLHASLAPVSSSRGRVGAPPFAVSPLSSPTNARAASRSARCTMISRGPEAMNSSSCESTASVSRKPHSIPAERGDRTRACASGSPETIFTTTVSSMAGAYTAFDGVDADLRRGTARQSGRPRRARATRPDPPARPARPSTSRA